MRPLELGARAPAQQTDVVKPDAHSAHVALFREAPGRKLDLHGYPRPSGLQTRVIHLSPEATFHRLEDEGSIVRFEAGRMHWMHNKKRGL